MNFAAAKERHTQTTHTYTLTHILTWTCVGKAEK